MSELGFPIEINNFPYKCTCVSHLILPRLKGEYYFKHRVFLENGK